ncbi:NAD-dependent epimerase/dehydratase family protein [Nocardia bhagyanarayanae]|uniref:Nucleoside-diphosphate-sugar epimerase n=1 Tax=Nocardia bhagyanarayanae TaxID=1215925 RepID=A0A543FHW3_9NOCA|nr:NAD-dependent epimerase/dehydratase family protein [Nocardia bhagyanarayanae]TQM33453.1 nucleoside-diphosphate-sugar epimerase [Nocardia bhagyanarayanae]
MSLHVVVGAGPVGTATALLLAERGDDVRLLSRSGSGPEHPRIARIRVDATDAAALTAQCAGARALHHCAGLDYARWATGFPPLIHAAIHAAEASGALLLTVGNLYGYGEFDGPVDESHPLRPNSAKGRVRADLWNQALTAHQQGRIRTAEVRGSDYLGVDANSTFTAVVLPAVVAGKTALFPGDPDTPHSWTAIDDMARTLLAVADDETSWGRAWHAPTAAPMPVRALAELTTTLTGAPPARVRRMPSPLLRAAGLFNADAREIRELRYQFDRPFVMDSTAATKKFQPEPTSTRTALSLTLEARNLARP